MEYDNQQLFIKAELELQSWSLEPSDEDIKEAYKEFAEEYPVLNQEATLAVHDAYARADKERRKRGNSVARATVYSLTGLVASLLTTNVVGIVASSACLYSCLFTKVDKE